MHISASLGCILVVVYSTRVHQVSPSPKSKSTDFKSRVQLKINAHNANIN